MKNPSYKVLSITWGVFFVALLMVFSACVLDDATASAPAQTSEEPEILVPVDPFAEPEIQNPELETDSNVTIPLEDSLPVDSPHVEVLQKDSVIDTSKYFLAYYALDSIETVYYKDTCRSFVRVRDTIYDTIPGFFSYMSFLYKRNDGSLDTVTMMSADSAISCDFTDSLFSCKHKSFILPDGPAPEYIFLGEYHYASPVYCIEEIVDTVYGEPVHVTRYDYVYDTTLVNYGENRLTDFIPPEEIYAEGENPFDSTAMRDLLDTLDLRKASTVDTTLWLNSLLSFTGFPVQVMFIEQVMYRCCEDYKIDLYETQYWPKKKTPRSRGYSITNIHELESDTTVTWTLGYTHYESGVEETDSIQVTTFFKVVQESADTALVDSLL